MFVLTITDKIRQLISDGLSEAQRFYSVGLTANELMPEQLCLELSIHEKVGKGIVAMIWVKLAEVIKWS
jgi:hypothetical protein